MYILLAILVFGILIAVHELGHFLVAKACGVRVDEFAIGMGPAIWKKQKGETLYAVRCLPIGGFCAMAGEANLDCHEMELLLVLSFSIRKHCSHSAAKTAIAYITA